MSDPEPTLDLHLTMLFGWLVRTVGAAPAWPVGGFALGWLVALWIGDALPAAAGALVGLLGFVATLWLADAPLPYDVRENE